MFFLLLLIPLVSAFSVNSPVTIEVLLQDDSVGLVSLSNASCLISVFFFGNNSFVVHDQSMTAGIPYQFTFVPDTAGSYRTSVLCSYLNESVNYHEDFAVTSLVSTPSGAGRGVLVLNANISTAQDSYAVNIRDPIISFPVTYTVNSIPKSSGYASWDLLRDGNKVDSGVFLISGTGQYVFEYDARELTTGDYEIFMWFDGVSKGVNLSVYDAPINFLTGLVIDDSTGEVVTFRVVVLFFILLLVLFVLWLLFYRRKAKKVQNQIPRQQFGNR